MYGSLGQNIDKAMKEGIWKSVKASRAGPDVFFAILFGEASSRQASLMADILEDFCKMSGQKINLQKPKKYVNKNTDPQNVDTLHQNFGMPVTKDL